MLGAPVCPEVEAVIGHEAEPVTAGVVIQANGMADLVGQHVGVPLPLVGMVSDDDVRVARSRDSVHPASVLRGREAYD